MEIRGKVRDICPNCKNHKSVTRQYDGKNDIRIIEVECEDPYDDMVKTLDADSDICCSKFEPKSDHGRCPWGKEPCDKISLLQHELEMDGLRKTIRQLGKEKTAHMKGIERLKKSQERLQNQIKNLQTTNEESYKREEKLEDKCHKLERRLLDENKKFDRLDSELLIPLARVLYPREAKICKPYSKVINDIKNLKVYSEENEMMYEDLKYWKERCHKAETDVTTLNSKVDVLKNKNDKYLKKITDQQVTHYKQCARILELECMVNKFQSGEYDDILAKDIEIKSLQAKYEDAMAGWKDAIDTNDRLDQTISDLKEKNENLTKAVERRDRWVEEFKNDVYTLQNEVLNIRNIAQKAYDDTNRD